ncbi:GTP-binding protein [Corynebacterium pseudodiphtheriticum]|uniref:sulfate adenylyltransferase subunit 1 n=1 Tax=Corynebacterium pseudodiphtheriticum TaxID=37637 RepID=UPI00254C5C1F|nr:GTP-binding protein [Corynebacterium pseudodiphtheriticum]MDK8501323.1 GTP-binding protein [Corynebacterium pseudodiphtheriticum]MDK8584357.1 GTP-binding protein [Corynebacterium pseudodiphtheriticum]MDK8840045.1 GTP-binding protein [Corynebacterium pseudodiphtheriticum]
MTSTATTATTASTESTATILDNRRALRICTAGSVDDGKSTFVGRLLHDTKSVLSDQLEAVAASSSKRGFDGLDFSLLVDGLRAEREQGITIDVAYRYFATDQRSFILADTPGHVQYTRNTITGMSTAEVVILLIDARYGVVEQTKRHLHIAALLGIQDVIIAVNKIDLVGYDQAVYEDIQAQLADALAELGALAPRHTRVVPISALAGDNVVERSAHTPWYDGQPIVELLDTIQPAESDIAAGLDFRFPIQYVIREPQTDYRGYAGRVTTGAIAVGDAVTVSGGRTSTVVGIDTADRQLQEAHSGDSVVLRLADEIDLVRGDFISAGSSPRSTRKFTATLVGLSDKGVRAGQKLHLLYDSGKYKARVASIETRQDRSAQDESPQAQLALNEIATVELETAVEIAVDDYAARGKRGAFVLADPHDGNSLAAGLIGQK